MSNSSTTRYSDGRDVLHPPVLSTVRAAGDELAAAKAAKCDSDIEAAHRTVQRAVDDARNVDVAWGAIGDALGITRGNAYQRYRPRPNRPSPAKIR